MWWDGARRCTHIPVGMGVLAPVGLAGRVGLAAGKAAGDGVNEAVDAGLQEADNGGEELGDGIDHR